MRFTKDVVFLGYREMQLKDGTILYSVSMFVDDSTLEVNVVGTNLDVVSAVRSLSFADKCCATFMLRKTDKLYRLSLVGLANV